ncbi:patatin-like phospholipase family protein [Aestuariibacter halophilus]|uniref:Patatin-like phospholipase family protein n=1 Tax=Fluctibacter halophilus TaxID=226011 RepID=A0ABS8G5F3_9ALTE|nr:patatin-like phospholipase family protein [Aestuariibacter halophilus]MCC2614904.1 patatin-like phospholipase family protein [Aestuariibacter halophilus]
MTLSSAPFVEQTRAIVPIFSGGGTRLPAHIGIFAALNELNLTFDHVVGISGGSIVSALYSCGHSLDSIMTLALDTDFRQFRGYSIFKLLRDGGLSDGVKFERWMDRQLDGQRFCDLSMNLNIVATDVNGGGPVIFNRHTSPEMKISEAVRYSMSIPLVFSFKPYKSHVLVDGAILSEDALFRNWAGDNTPNVCFRLKSQQVTTLRKRQAFFQLPEFVFMLIRTFMTALSREYVHAEHWHNTIVVDTGTLSSVDFSMTEEQKKLLYQDGYQAAMAYLPKKLDLLHQCG